MAGATVSKTMSGQSKTEKKKMLDKVAILDAGSQYGKLIDRRIRELNVECDLLPLDASPQDLEQYKAIVISGGPQSVIDPKSPKPHKFLFTLDKPMLGICYGMQLMAYHFEGGNIGTNGREDGQTEVILATTNDLFKGLCERQIVMLTHGDSILELPIEFQEIGSSRHTITAIEHVTRHIYGVQFHPEVDLTACGKDIFKNFLFNIARITPNYTV